MCQSYEVGPSDTRVKRLAFWGLALAQCMLAAFCLVAMFAVGGVWGWELYGSAHSLEAILVLGIFTIVMGYAFA